MGDKFEEKISIEGAKLKEKAKTEVIDDVKKNPISVIDTAPEMVSEAKKKVDENAVAEQKTKDVAKDKLDKAQGEFTDTVKALEARTALVAHLAAVDPAKDFSHAIDEMEKIKLEAQPVQKFFGESDTVLDDIDAQEVAIQENAREFYRGLASGVTEIAGIPDINPEELQQLMHLVGEMEQAKSHNFVGTTEREAKKLAREYGKQQTLARKVITANISLLSPDSADAFRRLESALVQMDDAELGKNPKEKEKAQKRMEVIIAEQEARRVWQGLPYNYDPNESWRSVDITQEVGQGWNKNGANYQNYMQALNAFQLGVKMSESKDPGADGKAVQLFKVASEKWRLVQKAHAEALLTKENVDKDKQNEQHTAQARLAKMTPLTDKLFRSTAQTLLTAEMAKFRKLSEKINGKIDAKYDYSGVIGDLDTLEQALLVVEKKYDDLKKTLSSKLDAACVHASGIGEKTEANVLKVVSDYMNDVYDHLDGDSQKMLQGMGLVKTLNLGIDQGLIPIGVFDTHNFKGEIWVTYGADGHAKVESGTYRESIDTALVEDLTETPESLEKRKQTVANYLDGKIDEAFGHAKGGMNPHTTIESDPDRYYGDLFWAFKRSLADYTKDGYRFGDKGEYQKNYEAICGLIVVKYIPVDKVIFKVTAGRSKSGEVISKVERFEAEKESH
ncbi:hypothetical protein IT413_01445 [Candidatus Peregrinibacteria bacterium]|nr:hypothetical protein [Candidatus Peregrinibacteria bacterium]